MNDDLGAAGGLASLASSGMTIGPSGKGKRKTAVAPKPKKTMTPKQRARESGKRKGRRHAAGARDEAIAAAAVAAQQEVTKSRVAAAMREHWLTLIPSNHTARLAPRVGLHPHVRFLCLPAGLPPLRGVFAGGEHGGAFYARTRARAHRPQRHTGGRWLVIRRHEEMRAADAADMLSGAGNLFDEMPAAGDEDYMHNFISEGDAPAARYDPNEPQSQDGRRAFTPSTFDQDQTAFMRDPVDMDLDVFPLDHEFLEDYGQEQEDECDIEGETLFEDELTNQAVWEKQPKRKRKWTKAYTAVEDKLLCECWRDIGQDPKTGAENKHSTFWTRVHREFHEGKKFPPYQTISTRGWVSTLKRWRVIQQECNKFYATLESVKARPASGIGMQDMAFQALEAFKAQQNGKCFNLSHCFRVIKGEEKFKAQYAALKSRGGSKPWRRLGTARTHGRGGRPTPRMRTSGMQRRMP
ncbi:Lectin-domain containing receptor kinase A4.3 [Hordeum vulgare]|nr:Lectin-domain containing receptor kinase A4.3 [Hordeum vulgare]